MNVLRGDALPVFDERIRFSVLWIEINSSLQTARFGLR
jgi:hypothetical protein